MSPVNVEVPNVPDDARTFKNPVNVEVAVPVTEREFKVVLPAVREVAKRFVDEAVVEKRLVVVALVVVDVSAVKLVRVEDALDINPLLKYQVRLSVAVVDAV